MKPLLKMNLWLRNYFSAFSKLYLFDYNTYHQKDHLKTIGAGILLLLVAVEEYLLVITL